MDTSRTEIERFAAEVSASPGLRAEIDRIVAEVSAQAADQIVAVARARGFSLTVDDVASLGPARLTAGKKALGDADLDRIAGGSFVISSPEPLASAARDLQGIGEALRNGGR